jgi:hypothetical protein
MAHMVAVARHPTHDLGSHRNHKLHLQPAITQQASQTQFPDRIALMRTTHARKARTVAPQGQVNPRRPCHSTEASGHGTQQQRRIGLRSAATHITIPNTYFASHNQTNTTDSIRHSIKHHRRQPRRG